MKVCSKGSFETIHLIKIEMVKMERDKFKQESILLQFEGPLLDVDDEGSAGNRGTEEDEEPASMNSVLSFSAYCTRLLCSKSLLLNTDVSYFEKIKMVLNRLNIFLYYKKLGNCQLNGKN